MECNKKVALRGGIKKKGWGAAGLGRSAMEKKEAEKSIKNENRRDYRERERDSCCLLRKETKYERQEEYLIYLGVFEEERKEKWEVI